MTWHSNLSKCLLTIKTPLKLLTAWSGLGYRIVTGGSCRQTDSRGTLQGIPLLLLWMETCQSRRCSWLGGGGWGGGGGGRGGNFLSSYIWQSMDVRAEWPPFSALPCIWLAPFFHQKVYDWPNFSGLVYERPHFSDVSRYMHIFFVLRFFEATYSLGIQWIDCYICLNTSNKWVQKNQRAIK